MAADATIVPLRSDSTTTPAAKAPAARRDVALGQPEQRAPQQPAVRELPPPPAREPSEPPAERASDPAATAKSGRRGWLRWILFALLPLALIVGGYWYVTGGQVMSTDDAYVEADKVGISTDVSGIVRDVDVTENQHVDAARSCSVWTISRFGWRWHAPTAQVGIVAQRPERAQGELPGHAGADQAGAGRCRLLRSRIPSSAESRWRSMSRRSRPSTRARRNLQNAQQKLASLNQQLAAIAANLNGDPDIPVEQHPRYLDAMAQRDEAARQLDHTVVKAPFAGIVTNVPAIAPGKYLQASMTAFYLVATDHVWVDANPKETELTNVRPGQPVTVTVDTYPDAEWHGTVESISPAAAQEFSLLPAQNTSGNWVKVVQRIPMRVRVDTQRQEPAAAARRDERRGRCRHRPCARPAALPDRVRRPRPRGP